VMICGGLASLSAMVLLTISGMGLPSAALSGVPQDAAPVARVDVRPASAAELLEIIEESDAEVVLVNIWATWCMPCRAEFPGIVRLYRTYRARGLEVVFVSGDLEADISQVRDFLVAQGVDFPSYLKVGKDMEFIDTFYPEWSGLLPATLIYDAHGTVQHFWEGEASYEVFESRILEVLSQSSEISPSNREESS
jgi:thiol-disulfide isomerase/thioredoxin